MVSTATFSLGARTTRFANSALALRLGQHLNNLGNTHVEHKRYVSDQLQKVQIVNEVKKDYVIEALRSLAELVTYELNQGVNSLPLKGWPLTGNDQLRPSLGPQVQKPFLPSQNQFQLLTPQQRQQFLAQAQAQGSLGNTPNSGDMDPRRFRVLSHGSVNGKDGQPTGAKGGEKESWWHWRGSSSAIHCLGRADVSHGSQVLVVQPWARNMQSCLKQSFRRGVNEKERGMALPFQPLIMCFTNINYYVVVPVELKKQGILEDRLQLLVNITGAFRPGILTALVGVSGVGKTTLMDVLAGRMTSGKRGALLFLVILKIK
ncbi:hypothetical protein Taro_022094 [Colocasia esculenta]|uniref:ABC transporter domain-containing protein n=1 Tax=Colocasia esculenta TaxID=4460 RepID=A0A843UTG1_COLES|nr:hypothetical protein [Colocasia esculenta]